MPEWLLRDENYKPKKDKDTFIDRSILNLLSILAKIKINSGYKKDKLYVNTSLKIAFTFMQVLMVNLTRNFTFITIIDVCLLLMISMMDAKEIIKIIKLSIAVAVITYVVLIPAAIWGNFNNSILMTFKVMSSVTLISILSHSTRWNSLTSALKRFYIPDIFIFVLDITIKYIVMLGEIMLNMLYSLKLRSVGRNKSKYASISGVAGTMFIKSKEMAEEMYAAMQCRCFNGVYHKNKKSKFSFADLIYIIINVGLVAVFVYLERI